VPDKKDYYDILGVSRDASNKEIKQAYRNLARKYHPDVNQEDGAEQKFKEINEAYEVLSDSQKRAAYDRLGHAAFNGSFSGAESASYGFPGFDYNFSGFSNPFDIFEEFFGFRSPFTQTRTGSKSRQRAKKAGRDLLQTIKIPFAAAVKGTDYEIAYRRLKPCLACKGSGAANNGKISCPQCQGSGRVQKVNRTFLGQIATISTCPTCHGSGEIIKNPCPKCRGKGRIAAQEKLKIKIPAGVETGHKLRFRQKGDAGENGGLAGDLYIQIKVEPSKIFQRRGPDVYLDLPITFSQAALGDTLEVPVIDPGQPGGIGRKKIKIPAGIDAEAVIKLSGQGMPKLSGTGKGDEYIRIKLQTPKKLSPAEKEIFEKLKKTNSRPKNLWDRFFS